jgi:hypothetical protein
VAISAFGVAFAQDKTIKFATQNPKGHPLVMGMEKFAEIVRPSRAARSRSTCSPAACWAATRQRGVGPAGRHDRDGLDELRHPGQPGEGLRGLRLPLHVRQPKEADAVVDGPFGKKMHAKLETRAWSA